MPRPRNVSPKPLAIVKGTMLYIILGLAVVIVAAFGIGALRWKSNTLDLQAHLELARERILPTHYDEAELANLPAPVQRYFQKALRSGQPMIAAVHMAHTGTMNMSATAQQWKPFTSTQQVITQRPGFIWDARVAMMPGISVYVHDAYVGGEGILNASVLGLVSMANLRGFGDIALGELMRFFAEAPWYPTALLPSQGVVWQAVDDHSAYATLTDGDINLKLLFRFNEAGLIDTVLAESRARVVGKTTIHAPWQGRFWNYATRDGMQVPLDAEVEWLLPDVVATPYFRGHIAELSYEYAK
jgi:hypothetical protein